MKPRFITLDGIDGAGKSTNLAVMKAWFEKHQLPVLFTREPGVLRPEKHCVKSCSTLPPKSACVPKPC